MGPEWSVLEEGGAEITSFPSSQSPEQSGQQVYRYKSLPHYTIPHYTILYSTLLE